MMRFSCNLCEVLLLIFLLFIDTTSSRCEYMYLLYFELEGSQPTVNMFSAYDVTGTNITSVVVLLVEH